MDKALKTRLAIAQGLIDELEIKTFDEVTVVDVCKRASVSRSTFYRYFGSIPDVVAWHFSVLVAQTTLTLSERVDFFGDRVRCLEQLQKYRATYLKALHFDKFISTATHMSIAGDSVFRALVESHFDYKLNDEENIILEYYGYVTLCAILKWLYDGRTISSKDLASILYEFLPKRFRGYVS